MIFGLKQYLIIGAAALLLGGGFYAGCQIQARRVERAKLEAKVAEMNAKVATEDRKNAEEISKMSDDQLIDLLRRGGVLRP